MSDRSYPIRLDARLDQPLSRWLWLVKWFLAIPHYVVLFFLWIAFVVVTVVAGVAILFTGHYPKSIFEFTTGVLRWSWRVSYYSYSALGTDRYPPFSLADDPTYPARLTIPYPDHLSRGLVLIKWWLLLVPHYLIMAFFVGGTTLSHSAVLTAGTGGGLIGLLTLVAAISLAVTGGYPRGLYDLIVGLNRWVVRVGAYGALMTDEYPPFRLDMGGAEPPALGAHADGPDLVAP
jgi:hypothetical protein